ncbi:MAG: enoyl-CoA hydratase/isomerase family protein [Alphaproteobacteria bacterium]|nr:enoyl-CoA hydratase/isomerase family protein [Alphaproteobacteria bacterium]
MSQLDLRREGRVAIVRLAPPDGFMTIDTVRELGALAEALAGDAGVAAVVLTGGQPGVFVRHYSVRELEALSHQLRAKNLRFSAERIAPQREIDRLLSCLETMPKAVIAAINGHAMGGGFELALACDLRIAEMGPYWLGLPEINIGLLPGAGGTQKLARLVGQARALELTLLGRTLSPVEAAGFGLVHEAVPAPVIERALALARQLAEKPQPAFAHIKRLVRQESGRPLADGLAVERTLFLDTLVSDEALARMTGLNRGDYDIRSAKNE